MSRQLDGLTQGITTLTTSAAVVTASPGTCQEMFIQSDPDNTVDVFIGGSAGQPIQLQPGQSMTLRINNPAVIYGKSASGTATVNFLVVQPGQ